jgi:hypothetical protein
MLHTNNGSASKVQPITSEDFSRFEIQTIAKKMKIKAFNIKLFLISTIICGILTFITFCVAFGIDEGTTEKTFLTLSLEKLFNIFRFPTHTFFSEKMRGNMFICGLFINCIFYGILIERLFSSKKISVTKNV